VSLDICRLLVDNLKKTIAYTLTHLPVRITDTTRALAYHLDELNFIFV
jgi:hypothetical protein